MIATLTLGEVALLTGLWFAWWPLALIVTGVQLVALGLLSEHDIKAGGGS